MEMPSTKVTTFAVAGALATVVTWLAQVLLHQNIPGEVQAAIAIIVGFRLAYWVPETRPASSAREHLGR